MTKSEMEAKIERLEKDAKAKDLFNKNQYNFLLEKDKEIATLTALLTDKSTILFKAVSEVLIAFVQKATEFLADEKAFGIVTALAIMELSADLHGKATDDRAAQNCREQLKK